MIDHLLSAGGGIAGLVLAVILTAIFAYWLLFPWFVYHKLDKITKALGNLNHTIEAQALATQKVLAAHQVAPLPPLPGKEKYFIAFGQTINGPHPVTHLQNLLNKGTVPPETYVLREGGSEWQEAQSLFDRV